ncbi:hypothetical protein GCK72_015918 [Caenorhabditis remanei]|uniref:ubiquitinyl hydrolase 1 n=1 Tax=Caenorhabditis remanei TaxID=31234 RepID=A0A6A5GXQ0_CAERE|nr:hypothetical protein GCK72_015918 [Caenorhabditis remanei]KAF1759451.1 hypothetical protein GCK72_015918 [Caenorhabditis remanei]
MTILPVKKKREKRAISPSAQGLAPHPPPSISSPLASPRLNLPTTSSENVENSGNHVDYNSDDEYREENVHNDALEREFSDRLARRGLVIKEMVGDGACMFRAIAEQIYGDQEMHGQIRTLCMDYMLKNREHFKEFITEDYENYIRRKREDHIHGNHVELQAISEMFARPVEVYQYSDEPISVLLPRPEPGASGASGGNSVEAGTSSSSSSAPPPQQQQIQQNPPLRLSYHRAVHYNAILAPHIATIGVGLGLPGMIPGAADKDLMTKAMATSELEHLEETMLQDKIDMTDYQRTQADLEDQIARESLMSYLKDLERDSGAPLDSGALDDGPSTSSAVATSSGAAAAGGGASGLYEELLAAQSLVSEWDTYTDDVAIAEALLLSQQDYLSAAAGPSRQNFPDGGPSSSNQ